MLRGELHNRGSAGRCEACGEIFPCATALAILAVVIAGLAVRAPLARVPENAMKFSVGVMLTSFGIFWGAEGAGARWPGGDAALLAVAPAVLAFSILLVWAFRRTNNAETLELGEGAGA